MKKFALATAALMVAPLAAQADLLFTVGAKASVWDAKPTGQLDKDLSVEKNGLNLDSDNGTQLSVFFEHPLPFLPNIKLKSTQLELDGKGTINNASFAGQSFNEEVKTNLDLSHNDITLYWGLPLPVPYLDINFGLTGRQFTGSAEVSGTTTSTVKSEDLDLVLPMAYGEVKVGPIMGVYAGVDVNYIGMGKNNLMDTSAVVGYVLPIPIVDISLEGGYRSLSLQTDKKDVHFDADVDTKGAFFGASLAFGF